MTLVEAYDARVHSGAITRDPAQEYAALQLDMFARKYLSLHAKSRHPAAKWLPAFAGRTKRRSTQGLYLYGSVGRGKTMLMDMLVAELNSPRIRRVHFHAFMLEIHMRLKAAREAGTGGDFLGHVAAAIAADIDLLCFDELHVNDIADAMILGPLFMALMDRGVSIVATSNYRPDELYKDGLQRARFLPFIELIKRRMHIVRLDSPTDYRQRALSEHGTWFSPLTDQTWAKMSALFETLTDHQQTGPSSIGIDGRLLPLQRANARCAWVTFDVLCRENRGAADYLALGHAFEAVFVDAIPRLGEDNRNEARRFMTLVDTLYDARRILVARAATTPHELYDGNANAFEWQRTVSRLLEMQAPEWRVSHLETTA